jgi:predicted metal-dependent hydrolase
MPTIHIPDIGEVELRKSKRARRVILKINQEGKAVVTVPQLLPYKAAEAFVYSHLDWLKQNLQTRQPVLLEPGKAIGRQHTLVFKISLTHSGAPKSVVGKTAVTVTHSPENNFSDGSVQAEAKKAAIRALRREAEAFLPPLLHKLATLHGYAYREVRIKAVHTRWGSCSSNRVINLSVWLMQLPDTLIEYVICHELTHLNHMNHSASFWDELSRMVPNYKLLKKELKNYAPRLL